MKHLKYFIKNCLKKKKKTRVFFICNANKWKTKMVKKPADKNLNLITKEQTTINVRPTKVAMNVEDP